MKVRRLPVTFSSDVRRVITRFFDPGGEPRIRLIARQQNQGVVACMNQGLSLARGRYICFAAADDCSKLRPSVSWKSRIPLFVWIECAKLSEE